ncbi:MAG TPA: DUF3618 domain-containing protein [Thermomicrobiales bacterium]|nr:DUF3618 domain-containing protein [Thermomicrobiales bacterium]
MGQEATRLDDDQRALGATSGEAAIPDDPDAIEQDIEQTRAEMSGTIDAIQERLNPEALKAQAKEAAHDATIGRVIDAKDQVVEKVQDLTQQATDKVHELTGGNGGDQYGGQSSTSQLTSTARETGGTIVDTIRANPIPAAIAGAGLGWFLTHRSDHQHHQGRSTYMQNTTMRGGYRGRQMNYRTGYTNWDQRQPDPGHLRAYEGDTLMSQMSSTGGDIVGVIQRHPIPAALAGVGIGWFLMRRSNGGDEGEQPYYYRPAQHTTMRGAYDTRVGYDPRGYGYQSYGSQGNWQQGREDDGGRMSEMAGTAQEAAGDVMHRAQEMGSDAMERVSEYGSMAQEQMSQLPQQAQDQFQHLRYSARQRMQDSPLMMGIVAMGLGLAAGMLLPETEKENEVFGERRDELMGRAQEMAGQAVERVQDVAQDAAEAAKETVQDAAQQQGQSSQSSATTA